MTLNQAILNQVTLNAPTAAVTIPIASGYTDLRVCISSRDTTSGDSAGNYYTIAFNGVGTVAKYMQGNGSSTGSGGLNNLAGISTSSDSGSTANTFCNDEIYIPNYGASGSKIYSVDTVTEHNAVNAYSTLVTGIWSGSGAITSITFQPAASGSFVAGSSFTVYGISKLGVTPTLTPKATGGDIIKNDGTYWYHAFINTGAFIPQTTLSADVLIVAGGGGSMAAAGGGGGGGLRYFASQSLSATQHTCIVGAGGAKGIASATASKGGDSSFDALVSTGGGFAGGTGGGQDAGTGGSGGGAGTSGASLPGGAGNTPSTSPSQGNNGGANFTSFPYPGGGGGGAGAVGQTCPSRLQGGNGGAGVNTYSSWASATSTGASGYYAGGGGGGVYVSGDSPTAGIGGAGGGGNGGVNTTAGASGSVNTGGGGGGSGENGTGGNGGSGIVIVRYAMA